MTGSTPASCISPHYGIRVIGNTLAVDIHTPYKCVSWPLDQLMNHSGQIESMWTSGGADVNTKCRNRVTARLVFIRRDIKMYPTSTSETILVYPLKIQ